MSLASPTRLQTETAKLSRPFSFPEYRQWRRTFRAAVVAVDGLVFGLAFLGATAIRIPEALTDEALVIQLPVVCGLMLVGLAFRRAYEFERVRSVDEVLGRIALGAIVGLVLIMIASYGIPQLAVGRGVFGLHALVAIPVLLLWRRLLFVLLRKNMMRPRAIVLGEPGPARKVARALSTASYGGAEVVGVLTPLPVTDGAGDAGELPVVGDYAKVSDAVCEHRVSQLIVVDRAVDEHLPVDEVLTMRRAGLAVHDGATVYEAITGRLLLEKLTPGWLLFANGLERTPFQRRVRHAAEMVIAAVLLLVLSPLLLAIALGVKLTSRGPIFYRQRRCGRAGRVYEMVKFRTMREDAEAQTGPTWAQAADPRVTTIGRFLRRTRLDELPQLINILRGEMSFIGPRPERPEFVEDLREKITHYDQRHSVLPGITGWAQVNYRYGSSIDDARVKLEHDLYYIQNESMLLDFEILLGTFRVILAAGNDR